MIEFYSGDTDTAIQRLCHSLDSFEPEWKYKVRPASDEDIARLQCICNQYGYHIPDVYMSYLRTMGADDGGLLEREWDGSMECDILSILDLFEDENYDAVDDLKRGLLLFSYHWTDTNCYLDVSRSEDNPPVLDRDCQYFTGSFEKYLFQKAFNIYQEQVILKTSVGPSLNSCDVILKRHLFACAECGGTIEERMQFVKWWMKSLRLSGEEAWFSDKVHYFSYNNDYALSVNLYSGMLIVFSCNDQTQYTRIEKSLRHFIGE